MNLRPSDYYKLVPFNALQGGGKTGINGTVKDVTVGSASIGGYTLHNNNASVSWVQIFFKPASEVTLGVTAPDRTIMIGASQSIETTFQKPIKKAGGTGLSVASTTAEVGATGVTVATTGDILVKE